MIRWVIRHLRSIRPLMAVAIVAACALTFLSPSSTRATDFVKIGSPLAFPVKLYSLTSLYDRNPKQYEAWAVGEQVDAGGNPLSTPVGVMLHYTGTGWTQEILPSNVPALRGIGATRYFRKNTRDGAGISSPSNYTWTSVAWAVGDNGTILKLDPWDGKWRRQQKRDPKINPSDPDRGCIAPELDQSSPPCTNWTTKNLKTVAVFSDTQPLIGGHETLMWWSGGFGYVDGLGTYLHDDWTNNASGYFQGGTGNTVTAMSFIDGDHGWLVGTNAANGRVWRWRRSDGFQDVSNAPIFLLSNLVGAQPTSVVAVQRRAQTQTNPLLSVVWIGATYSGGTLGRIIRLEETNTGNPNVVATQNLKPVLGMTATRLTRGSNVNLVSNGDFTADRIDSDVGAKKIPDGWRISSRYTTGRDTTAETTNLVGDPSDPANKVFIGETWQWRPGDTGKITAVGANGSNFGQGFGFPEDGTTYGYSTSLNEADVTSAIMTPNRNSWTAIGYGLYHLGFYAYGYLRIPDGAPTQYDFKIDAPNGRVSFDIENDTADLGCACDVNSGVACIDAGKPCSGPSDCSNGICREVTRYSTVVDNTNLLAWQTGICNPTANAPEYTCNGGANNGMRCTVLGVNTAECPGTTAACVDRKLACFDSHECGWGTCSKNITRTCGDSVSGVKGRYCRDNNDCKYCDGGTFANQRCTIDDDCPPAAHCVNPTIGCVTTSYGLTKLCRTEQTDKTKWLTDFSSTRTGLCEGLVSSLDESYTWVKDEGVCNSWGPTACTTATPVINTNSPTATAVFPGRDTGGIKVRVCDGGPNNDKSCVADEQCSPGTCIVKGGGWYPFMVRYDQENAGYCAGHPEQPCTNNSVCQFFYPGSGSTCQNGNWCNGGSKHGQVCTNSFDCLGGGTCIPQYQQRCTAGNTGLPGCWADTDCDSAPLRYDGRCEIKANPAMPSKFALLMKRRSEATYNPVASGNVTFSNWQTGQAEVVQEAPLSTQPGVSYRVSGRYKVEFYDESLAYSAMDPRRLTTSLQAGVRTRCSNASANRCGYDSNLFETNKANGVTNGHCADNAVCKTNPDCVGHGGDQKCQAGWQNFSIIVTKQNRTTNASNIRTSTDDGGQSLEVQCFADIGARISCDDVKIEAINDESAGYSPTDTIDIWAVGGTSADGFVTRNTLDLNSGLPASDTWLSQAPPSDKPITAITAADPYHLWAVGDPIVGQNAFVTRLAPGNITGYAWIGTSETAGNPPLGWVDFNCGNQGSCAGQPSTFGVDAMTDVTVGRCEKNVLRGCKVDGDCGADGRCARGVVTGSAWLGTADPSAKIDYGRCQNVLQGKCVRRVCSNFPGKACVNNSQCPGGTCQAQQLCFSTADCPAVTTGYCLGFSSASIPCTGDQECIDAGGSSCAIAQSCNLNPSCSGTSCWNGTWRSCTEPGQCAGTCEKNAGFRCLRDSDCQVSCNASASDSNPLACRPLGWLSFDRNVAGTPPAGKLDLFGDDFSSAAHKLLAQYASSSLAGRYDELVGWARLQLGRCSNNGEVSCFQDSDCGGGSCSYANAPSCVGKTAAQCNAEAGWVSLQGASVAPNAGMRYYSCQDPTTATPPNYSFCTEYTNPSQSDYMCTQCSSCTRSCSDDVNVACTADADCRPPVRPSGQVNAVCKSAGRCDNNLDVKCFTSAECGGGSCRNYGATCTSCTQCQRYGTYIDVKNTKGVYGYAWSPDLGWLDMSALKLGGQAFFQTKFGDIYSSKNIGSPQTPLAPGAPGGSPFCNATYRLVAGGTIQNFCSNAPNVPNSPFKQENAPLFLIPRRTNQFTAKIGSLDIDGLATPSSTVNGISRNKFGNEIIVKSGSPSYTLTDVIGVSPQPLNGRVYFIDGDLNVNQDMTFKVGPVGGSGAGTFVVRGNINIAANLYYDAPQYMTSRRQLPSVAFIAYDNGATAAIVEGNLTISPNVSQVVGAYYVENMIEDSSAPPDVKLTAYGLMVAKEFKFDRTYTGASDVAEAAELVIYDGRLQQNTPPGFSVLANGLPTVKEQLP